MNSLHLNNFEEDFEISKVEFYKLLPIKVSLKIENE